jgi:hypothetical protein
LVTLKSEVNRAAKLRITIKKGMVMELDGVVCNHVGSMIGVKSFANGKTYHLYQYYHNRAQICMRVHL